jgi:hypothetical protein
MHHRPASANASERRFNNDSSPSPSSPSSGGPSYVALQQFEHGVQVRYSLTPCSESDHVGPLVAHRSDEDRRVEAERNEKQQLLQALFHTGGRDGAATSSPPTAAVPFSPRWYPLAQLLMYFLPQHYPASVNSYYLTYSKWVFVGSILGTASSVLSMQCLLVSLGLGAAALPASAAINWVLKDGLGQLGGMLFASMVSTRFDMQPIRYRLLSAVVLDASILLEILTPLVPTLFLPLASLANIGKNISWLGASASRAAIHRSFLRRENLADVTAKSGSQTILASLGGTALGIGLSVLTGTNTLEILVCFLVLSCGHIMATYRALRRVVINHLTEQRLDMLSDAYLRQLAASATAPPQPISLPSPAALQRLEPLFWFQRSPSSSTSPLLDSSSASDATAHLRSPCWSNSSVDASPRFEHVVASVVRHPSLHLDASSLRDAAAGAEEGAQTAAVYRAWLDQFAHLPFVASLHLSTDAHDIATWNDSHSWSDRLRLAAGRLRAQLEGAQRSEEESSYAHVPVAAPESEYSESNADAPTLPHRRHLHLHVRLLFQSHATSDDVLQSALYVNHLRREWQRIAVERESNEDTDHTATDSTDIVVAVHAAHVRALAILRADSDSLSSALHLSPASTTIAPPVAPTHNHNVKSNFVSTLRANGYATDHHFVQDHNVTRITLQGEETTAAAAARER